jgi:hypothetical protein
MREEIFNIFGINALHLIINEALLEVTATTACSCAGNLYSSAQPLAHLKNQCFSCVWSKSDRHNPEYTQ